MDGGHAFDSAQRAGSDAQISGILFADGGNGHLKQPREFTVAGGRCCPLLSFGWRVCCIASNEERRRHQPILFRKGRLSGNSWSEHLGAGYHFRFLLRREKACSLSRSASVLALLKASGAVDGHSTTDIPTHSASAVSE